MLIFSHKNLKISSKLPKSACFVNIYFGKTMYHTNPPISHLRRQTHTHRTIMHDVLSSLMKGMLVTSRKQWYYLTL